jgi:CDP-paratose 2-epimerase
LNILVTGSTGLIGSEAVEHFDKLGYEVHGIDNNMRRVFFGDAGDTAWNLARLKNISKNYHHHSIDIRSYASIEALFKKYKFNAVIHCAAQPSHDKAREIPLIDFEVNAKGTINLLEASRNYCPEAIFIHMSTNKVYGDAPNELEFMELETRWDYADRLYYNGIDESFRVDQSLHSLFGASKLAGDIIAQEYSRTYGLRVFIFRGGCLTGPKHSGVELHGFLSYLVKAAINKKKYNIFGYKGKQVRDQIHSKDVVRLMESCLKNPTRSGVYNLGGGRENSVSILEAINKIEELSGEKVIHEYIDENRLGDHICYISNINKIGRNFVGWKISKSIDDILIEMIGWEKTRLKESV